MSARKFLRVELTSVSESGLSHLVCIGCGRFNVDFAIVVNDHEAIGGSSEAGVHKKCIKNVKAKRGVK